MNPSIATECAVCLALRGPEPDPIVYPAPRDASEWRNQDLIRGLFLGGAVGDALGALVHAREEMPGAEPAPLSLKIGGATQFGLFTVEGTLRMVARASEKGIGPAWDMIGEGIDRCLFVRGNLNSTPQKLLDDRSWAGWLVRQHALHTSRGDFSATIAARRSSRIPSLDEDAHELHEGPNDSDGAGALVRTAAVGALVPLEWAFRTGAWSGGMTHGGRAGFLAPAALSRIVAGVLSGETLLAAAASADVAARAWPGSEAVCAALRAGGDQSAVPNRLPSAAEALARGLAAAAVSDDFLNPIQDCAIAYGTAAAVVAGQLIGLTHGASALPSSWRLAIDVIGPIEEMSDATGLCHRYWVSDRHYEEIDRAAASAESPLTSWLWPRFPGW